MQDRFIIAGTDPRCRYLAENLSKRGFDTVFLDKEMAVDSTIESVDCDTIGDYTSIVVFPPAALIKDVCKLMQHLKPGSTVFAGKLNVYAHAVVEEKKIRYFNLLDREAYTLANALPTAEGALMLVMENTPITVARMRVLVLGGGKCAKATADLFCRCRAVITLVARSQADRDWAMTHAMHSMSFSQLEVALLDYDAIVNTVPERVVPEAVLQRMPQGTVWVELASKPGGIDEHFAQEIGCRYLFAPGLPGRVAPLSAAKIMEQTILEILTQER